MSKKLTIDEGNTAVKIAVWHDDKAIKEATYERFTPEVAEDLCRRYPDMRRGVYSSTRGIDSEAVAALRRGGVDVLEVSADLHLPIVIGYGTPKSLGPDRIAAAAGGQALAPGRDLLIVDVGSACTYDRVTADGTLVGGNIAPGIAMRLRALHEFTAALPEVDRAGDAPICGYSTLSAMRGGAIRGVVAEIEYYRRHAPSGTVTLLTGGDAAQVMPLLDPADLIYQPQLVNIGLISILNHNETK